MKRQFRLLNVHCAGCADALEQKLNEIEGVKVAQVNFITKILTIEVENANHEEIIERVLKQVTKFDRMIKIEDPRNDVSAKEKRAKLIKIALISCSVLFLILGIIFEQLKINFVAEIVFYVISYILVAYEVIWASILNISHGKVFDENFLMTIATIGAFAISKFSEAVMVMLLYQIGELLQGLAVNKSKNAINSLLDIKAKVANLITEDGEIQVELSKVPVGAQIRVKPGENVPLDGMVVMGSSSINTMALTGESAERQVGIGDEILSGSINGEGVLIVKVTKSEKDSTVSKIIDLVETATTKKAKTENFISKFAKYYTPIVCFIALCLVIIPCLFVGFSSFSTYLYRGLVFLVVSCPCALVISVPLGFFAGLGASARQGVLIKGSNYLEALNKVETVVFDKTGTLTTGVFEIDKIYTYSEQNEDEVLEFVAYAENYSNHRIAKSIVNKYLENHTINGAWIEDIEEHAGLGISAKIFMMPVLVGSSKLLEEQGVKVDKLKTNETAIYLAVNGVHSGTITLKDKIKEDSIKAVNQLKQIGIKEVAMFTGDNSEVAKSVAEQLNLDTYYANMLPQDKVDKLKELHGKNKAIAFVGDGINDAPVLASVDVGVAMGGVGSDVAVEASDVVIMTDEPSKLTNAILTAKKTHKIVMQNVIFALIIKFAVLILSALGYAEMWLAIFADVGVSILAVLNSLRALKAPKFKKKIK